ncbi:hypothetical protein HXX76_002612 [Chlamydomonas incerta]|uniref:rRNA processing protein n=1 Tax=Chlamydomonas incerta TaxID=51695 RepID=A0A835W9U6_CHLIN|nr:hypothetical protein HXX76_002612 [Chlamydomonas incerta]|eukprot:KAG2442526.1 hypothetical protein HXX76_002612 [Chlamydomonas incerta]
MKGRAGDGDGPQKKHARRVGAGLSLDKFASAGVSKFDKRRKIERLKKQKVIQHSKLGKLKKKLEARGVLAGGEVKDSIAELEALDGVGSGSGLDSEPGELLNEDPRSEEPERQERVASHAHAESKSAAAHRRQGQARQAHRDHDDVGAGGGEEEGGRGPHGQQQKQRQNGPAGPGGKRHRDEDAGEEVGGEPRAGSGSGRGRGSGGREGAGRGGGRDGGHGRGRGGERLSQLQRLAHKVAEQKAEEQQAKEAARKEREERQKRLAAAEKVRKEQKHLHFKRNAKGQPLMRFRMEKLLGQIEKGG